MEVRVLPSDNYHNLAFAQGDLESSRYVLLGIPFDATSTFISGSRFFPDSIRKASWNLEDYLLEFETGIKPELIHDHGNIEMYTKISDVDTKLTDILNNDLKGKIPIILGGEHSITPIVQKTVKLPMVVFDAHLDYRDEYLGNKHSHACATRRVAETIGTKNIIVVGARSASENEYADAKEDGLKYIMAGQMESEEFNGVLEPFLDAHENIYLSIDMDAIDPAYAPMVGTPEPYGIAPSAIKDFIEWNAKKIAGMDIVEGLGAKDDLSTAMLAADFIRRYIALRER